MKSGTEKKPNPRTPSLGKFLRSLETPVEASKRYVRLANGQIVTSPTWELMKQGVLPLR